MEVDVRIFIMPKEEILDPAAKAVSKTLQNLGYDISQVNLGKCIDLKIKKDEDIRERIEEICQKVLVNELTEDYYYSILH
jgi:phosphoribosylformylglycinamidine synthase